MTRLSPLFALVVAVALPLGAQAQDEVQAGVSAAVRGNVQLARGDSVVGQRLGSGEPIYLRDQITAGTDSGMQILLLDETVFTIGPNSEMTIDEFVYDPATGAGQVAASVTKGVFRFVTGQVAQNDPDKMSVKTPLGTIGIRGTIAGGTVSPERTEIVLLGPGINNNTTERSGAITVSNAQGSVEIERTGFGTVLLPEAPPSPPAASSNAFLQGLRSGTQGNASATQDGSAQQGGNGGGATTNMTGAPAATGQSRSAAFQSSVTIGQTLASGAPDGSDSDPVSSGIGEINTIAELNGSSGQFHFNDAGNLSDGGSYIIAVDINFSSRSIGGGNSAVSISPSSFSGGSFSILSNDFSTGRDGQAVFDGQNNITFACGGDTCNGAVVMKFRNFNGTVAGAMDHEVTVTNTNQSKTVSGSDTDVTRGSGATVGTSGSLD